MVTEIEEQPKRVQITIRICDSVVYPAILRLKVRVRRTVTSVMFCSLLKRIPLYADSLSTEYTTIQ